MELKLESVVDTIVYKRIYYIQDYFYQRKKGKTFVHFIKIYLKKIIHRNYITY
jgi:hypothetical protein